LTGRDAGGGTLSPPLALYIHVPWCLRKCPYCDFNSHTLREGLPEAAYVATLLRDLDLELGSTAAPAAPVASVFVGGGTPSLLSGSAVDDLLGGVRSRLPLEAAAEVTLEANPGTSDARRFAAYRAAGVNRLSLGAQSLSPVHLRRLGRIHGPEEVRDAIFAGRRAGFDNINLDLMYGLPDQSLVQARRDLEQALDLAPEHVSYYQLTVEPNTAFFAAPPPVPDHDLAADMHQQGTELLAARGFVRYETSAYARPGRRCVHNLNYWSFGDYMGIGAGAHGKRSDGVSGSVERTVRLRHPAGYLDARKVGRFVGSRRRLTDDDLVLEFAMNALRLADGFDRALFERNTGLGFATISKEIDEARALGLLEQQGRRLRASERGGRFLNDLVALFDRAGGLSRDPEVI
jgi:oxygen-independent coproporphyrinogen-3 oxidase